MRKCLCSMFFLCAVCPTTLWAETYQGQEDDQFRQFIGMNPGSYIGISMNYDMMRPNLPLHVSRLDDKKKQRKLSWGLQLGSFYAEQSAVEFRYTHYSSYHYLLQSPIAITDYSASLDVFGLDWILHMPLGSHFYAWARAGVAGVLSSVRIAQKQGASPGTEVKVRAKRFAPEAGLGIAMTLGKHMSVRLGYHYLYRPTRKDGAEINNVSGAELGINYLF